MSPDTHGGRSIRIFDTTLRDGEQSPGAFLNSPQKLQIAKQLAKLGVDVIEAGFPAATPDDLKAVQMIATEVGNPNASGLAVPIIAGLARANKSDIDKCWDAVQVASHPRIHVFLATSAIHMKEKLKMTPNEVKDRVGEMVSYAHSLCKDVEFSPEDATRSDPDFLLGVLAIAIQAGATTLNIPDTVGTTTPDKYTSLMNRLIKDTPGSTEEITWSVHCHDDLGMATANSLAGLIAGASQAEVTINGIGERAGNTALEEVVMAIDTLSDDFPFETGIVTEQIKRTSVMVSELTGIPVQPNKAVVGANAFAHEAGIHQAGVLANPLTYEIMDPRRIGLEESEIVFAKHSGRSALRKRLSDLGYPLEGEDLNRVFDIFKERADKLLKGKREFSNPELIELARIVVPKRN